MNTAMLQAANDGAVLLTVKCPAYIADSAWDEGVFYNECRCDVEVVVVPTPTSFRIVGMPNGCPINPSGDRYEERERVELEKRVTAAWAHYRDTYDGAPWCSRCGAKTRRGCDCGPILPDD